MLKVAEHLYFRVHDPDGDEVSFFTHSFKTLEEASYWVTELTQYDYTEHIDKVTDAHTFLFRHKSGYTLTLKGSHLTKLVEMADEDNPPPYPASNVLRRAMFYWKLGQPAEPPVQTEKPKAKPPIQAKERPTSGPITVGDMAKELGIPASKARNILRKAGIKKPDHGWTFEAGTDEEATIFDTIKSNL